MIDLLMFVGKLFFAISLVGYLSWVSLLALRC